jgi:hypothetical protein
MEPEWNRRLWAAASFCRCARGNFSDEFSSLPEFEEADAYQAVLPVSCTDESSSFAIFEDSLKRELGVVCLESRNHDAVLSNLNLIAESALADVLPTSLLSRGTSVPVESIIQRLRDGWSILVCGHSTVGAIATFVSEAICRHVDAASVLNRFACVTFGAYQLPSGMPVE